MAGVDLADRARASRWPARLDLTQSAPGLVLALFMWGHMVFVSSILLGKDAMWTITKFFEGYFFFGRSYPWIVSLRGRDGHRAHRHACAARAAQVPDQLPAVRDVPRPHADDAARGHDAVVLAGVTGFALFFLASRAPVRHAHAGPDRIGPFESADRVWSDHFWPLYIVLLLAVELHGGIGLYRLAVKWGWLAGPDPERDAAAG